MKTATLGHKGQPETDFPHNTGDNDVGNGIHNDHLSERAELQAQRNRLSRNLEALVAEAAEWYQLSEDEDAKQLYEHLEEAYTFLGEATEKSSDEEVTAVAVSSRKI